MSVLCNGPYINKRGPYWRADWLLQSYWTLREELWTEGGGRKEPGGCGLAGKIRFLWEETGNERAGVVVSKRLNLDTACRKRTLAKCVSNA